LHQVVAPDATTTTVSTSPIVYGQMAIISASVTANSPGSGTPTGSVDFYDTTTGKDLGTVPLHNGSAALSAAGLPAKVHVITAAYSGDPNFVAGNGSGTQTVTRAPLTVNISSSLMLAGNSPPPLLASVEGTPFSGTINYTTAYGDQITVALSTA